MYYLKAHTQFQNLPKFVSTHDNLFLNTHLAESSNEKPRGTSWVLIICTCPTLTNILKSIVVQNKGQIGSCSRL